MDSLTSIWPPATTKNAGGFAGVCRRLQEFTGFAGFSGGFRRFTGFQEVWHACLGINIQEAGSLRLMKVASSLNVHIEVYLKIKNTSALHYPRRQ